MTLLTEDDLMRAQRERDAAWADAEWEDLERETQRLRQAVRTLAGALTVAIVFLAVGLALA
jgi:hypothetical protein